MLSRRSSSTWMGRRPMGTLTPRSPCRRGIRSLVRDGDYAASGFAEPENRERKTESDCQDSATEFCDTAESNTRAATSTSVRFMLHRTFATCQALCLRALRQ
jgi:hypothetical protein